MIITIINIGEAPMT